MFILFPVFHIFCYGITFKYCLPLINSGVELQFLLKLGCLWVSLYVQPWWLLLLLFVLNSSSRKYINLML